MEQDSKIITITFSENESKDAMKFMEKHRKCCQKILGKPVFSTTGGGFSYIITPTGLGNCIIIKYNSCGKEKDITDISNW